MYNLSIMAAALFSKGGVPIIKMEVLDGICHEGAGSRGGLECHIPILKNDFY